MDITLAKIELWAEVYDLNYQHEKLGQIFWSFPIWMMLKKKLNLT